MSQIKSVFGGYADKMQIVVNKAKDKFALPWWKAYFDWSPPQTSLTFSQVIGRSRIEAAASIVHQNSAAPLRGRATLEKLSGEIPAISQKFQMNGSDYRDFLALQNMPGVDESAKINQLLEYLFGDIKKAGEAPHKRLDIMALEALSKGKMTITYTNNPDGIVTDDLDLLLPADSFADSETSWGNIAAKPLTVDIPNMVTKATERGITLSKILMSPVLWSKFINITEVKNFIGINKNNNNKVLVTLDNVNSLLTANMFPAIEIVDVPVGVEKDGKIIVTRPFDNDAATFVPAGKLGTIKNAIAIEQMQPVKQVNYATFDRVLISKWSQNDPFLEMTKCELNAIPAPDAEFFILKAVHA